jgi:hypothetical protein
MRESRIWTGYAFTFEFSLKISQLSNLFLTFARKKADEGTLY